MPAEPSAAVAGSRDANGEKPGWLARFLGGPWKLAFLVAFPLAELYILYVTVHDIATGGAWLLDLLFGWLLALMAAFIIAIPLGLSFMALNLLWQMNVWWWHRLPFKVTRR